MALFVTKGIKWTVSLNQRRMLTQIVLQEARWVMERTEQTESQEAEDAVREVTIGRLDASVYSRRALNPLDL